MANTKELTEEFIKGTKNIIESLNLSVDSTEISANTYAFYHKFPKHNDVQMRYYSYRTKISKLDTINNVTFILDNFIKNFTQKELYVDNFSEFHEQQLIDYIQLNVENNINQNIQTQIKNILSCVETIDKNSEQKTDNKFKNNCDHVAQIVNFANNKFVIIEKTRPYIELKGLYYEYAEENDENNERYKPINRNVFKVPLHPIVILYNNNCYLTSLDSQALFGFDKAIKINANKKLKEVELSSLFSNEDYSQFVEYSMKGWNAYKFTTFDSHAVSILKTCPPEYKDTFKKLKIKYNSDGTINFKNSKQESILYFICHRVVNDVIYPDSYFGIKSAENL